jgi:hypothetical protein
MLQCLGNLQQPVTACAYSSVSMTGLMPANSEIMWFSPHDSTEAGRIVARLWSEEGNRAVNFIICFGDVYGHKWVFNSNGYRITPCDDCPDVPVTQ